MPKVRVHEPHETCPLCRDRLNRSENTQWCPDCGVQYHRACVEEIGGNCVPGCELPLRPSTRQPQPSEADQLRSFLDRLDLRSSLGSTAFDLCVALLALGVVALVYWLVS